MGRLGPLQLLPGDGPVRLPLVFGDEHHLGTGNGGHGGAELLLPDQIVRDDLGGDHGPVAVVNHHHVVVPVVRPDGAQAVINGFLTVGTAGDHIAQLGDVELLGIGPEHLVPALQNGHADFVDAGVLLEGFQRVDDDGLVVDMEKLLGDVLMGAAADTAGSQNCDCCHNESLLTYRFR